MASSEASCKTEAVCVVVCGLLLLVWDAMGESTWPIIS